MANKDYAARYARFMLRHRHPAIGLLLGFTLLSALYVPQINLRNDPDSLLPQSNRYIATNLYSEATYGMGNLMVWGLKVKAGDIYQPWFVRLVDELYDDVTELKYANAANFIGLASPKMRNLGVSENGGLEFKRLIPVNGLAEDASILKAQLDYLRQGLEKHLVLQALLTYYEDADGNKCDMLDADGRITNDTLARVHQKCTARGTFIIGDFSNGMKDDHLSWIKAVKTQMADYEARYGLGANQN